jgi:uncharacterized protein with PIN domain
MILTTNKHLFTMNLNANFKIRIFTMALVSTVLMSCNNEELLKLKHENIVMKNELDSIKRCLLKEEAKKKFLGDYVNQERGLYRSFNFKGLSSVVVTDGIMGFPYATSYERDGEIIRIKTDKGDLLLTIKDSNTISGEGYAVGTYIKSNTTQDNDVIGKMIKKNIYHRD